MRYALIREMDVSNGEGVGVSLFVQGCHFHCHGCFNQETWDFNGGQAWTDEIKNKFFKLIDRPFIKRVSILGGEPLANENVNEVYNLIIEIKNNFPSKKVWLYTGYKFGEIINCQLDDVYVTFRKKILAICDVVVDGQFDISLQDINHKCVKFAGSTNQRIIDVKETLKQNKIVTIQN